MKFLLATLLTMFSFNAVAQITITDKEGDSSTTIGLTGSTNEHGKKITDDVLNTFKKGETTYTEVVAKLGKPTTVQNIRGMTAVKYSSGGGK